MSQTIRITQVIQQQGLLPLYFQADKEITLDILRTLYRAGIRAVEYTHRGSNALENFKAMIDLRATEMPEMLLGVGTIKNLEMAKEYLNAGADFLVSPGFVPEVASYCVASDVFYAPGCMTPTEIIAAENIGIRFIKLFPGNVLGPSYMSTIKDVFPNLFFMPTGGVEATEQSINAWFEAGVSAVGMGSKLISKKLMESRDYAALESATREVLNIISRVRS